MASCYIPVITSKQYRELEQDILTNRYYLPIICIVRELTCMLDHLKLKAIQPKALHVDMDELRDKDLTHHNTLKTRLRNNKIAIILHSPHLYKHLSDKGICELKDQLEFIDESFEQEPAE